MNRLIGIFLIILISSCQQPKDYHLSKEEKANLIKTIDSMYELDQGLRYQFSDLDSVYGRIQFSVEIEDSIERAKYKKSRDSLWDLTEKIDHTNTQKLIEITKEDGFPNNKRLGVYKSKAYMIFVHSPQEYFPIIEPLIEEEYNQNRISEYKKEYIFWHTKGRKGMPPMAGENGEAIFHDF